MHLEGEIKMAFSRVISTPENDSITYMKRSPLRMAIEQHLWFVPWLITSIFAIKLLIVRK